MLYWLISLIFCSIITTMKFLKKFIFIFCHFSNFFKFKETYKIEFLSYGCNQVVKKYLNYSNTSFIKIIWTRARLRTRCAPKWKTQEKRIFKHFCNTSGRGRGFRARNRARAHVMCANGFFQQFRCFLITWLQS